MTADCWVTRPQTGVITRVDQPSQPFVSLGQKLPTLCSNLSCLDSRETGLTFSFCCMWLCQGLNPWHSSPVPHASIALHVWITMVLKWVVWNTYSNTRDVRTIDYARLNRDLNMDEWVPEVIMRITNPYTGNKIFIPIQRGWWFWDHPMIKWFNDPIFFQPSCMYTVFIAHSGYSKTFFVPLFPRARARPRKFKRQRISLLKQ